MAEVRAGLPDHEDLFRCFRRKTKNKKKALELITEYSDPADTPIKDLVDTKEHNHKSLLQWASIRGWKDVCELLINQYQCDPHYEDDNKWTVLHNVCRNGHIDLVRYYCEEWNMDPLKKNAEGITPLDFSRRQDHPEITEYLESIMPVLGHSDMQDISSSVSADTPTVEELRKRLRGRVDWESYAIHLPGITQGSIDEIKSEYQSLEEQQRALFTKWLYKSDKYQKVSWQDVTRALELTDEFLKAMSEGGGDLTHLNIVFDGPPGVGKSSLKRVILGEPPLLKEEQNSTDIMENAVCAVSMDRAKGFTVVKNDDLIQHLAEVVLNHIDGKKSADNDTPQTNQSDHERDQQEETPNEPIIGLSNPGSQPAASISASNALQMIRDKLKHAKPSSDMFDSEWHHLIDSGGQPQFQDILPLVYSGLALQIVVMRLTEGLDEKPEKFYMVKGTNALKNEGRLQLTNSQYIERMCQKASSLNSTSHVMIVGTHKDKLGNNGAEAKQIEQLNKGLEEIRKKYKDVLICKSDDEIIFDLNTMATGNEREKNTEELQEVIKEVSEELAETTPVPLKWFAFHLDISRDISSVVRMDDCYKSGKALGMEEGAVRSALTYLNRAALLLYYPDDIPDLVLTKVDPLINNLSKLVKASFITPKRTLQSKCEELRNKGLFIKNFLKSISDNDSTSIALSDDEFLQLLQCLKIAASVDENDYFLPSALSLDPPSELIPCSCVPVGFNWNNRILPHGFFCTVAVELMHQSNDNNFKLTTNLKQCRDEICLREERGKIPGVVKLCNKTTWIQVSTSTRKDYCPVIYKAVDSAIQNTLERFERTGLTSPTVVSLCPLHPNSHHYTASSHLIRMCLPVQRWRVKLDK